MNAPDSLRSSPRVATAPLAVALFVVTLLASSAAAWQGRPMTGATRGAVAANAPSGPVASTASAPFVNFESGPVGPLTLTADGSRLLVLNTADARLEVYDVLDDGMAGWIGLAGGPGAASGASPGSPAGGGAGAGAGVPGSGPQGSLSDASSFPVLRYAGDVLTGLDPVCVLLHPTNPEVAFVANAVSDTVSVVELSSLRVVATIPIGDEPSGMAVANDRLFVACARAPQSPPAPGQTDLGVFDENVIMVADASPPFGVVGSVSVPAVRPRDVVAYGGQIFAIPQHSGNHTTLLSLEDAQAAGMLQSDPDAFNPELGLNPILVNPNLVFPLFTVGWLMPESSRIVLDSEFPGLVPQLPDGDVIGIDPVTLSVDTTPTTGVAGTLFDLERHPSKNQLWVVGTDARNRVRFEPVLKGATVENRVVVVRPGADVLDTLVLAPPYTQRQHAQPVAVKLAEGAFGSLAFVAALGTATVVVIDADDRSLVAEIPTGDLPAGLAVDVARQRLYVLCRGDKTLRVHDLVDLGAPVGPPVPLGYDPEPPLVSAGRQHLYDARASTGHGNGNTSCATCHVFGHTDLMAWDLGDPGGSWANFYPDLLGQLGDLVVDPVVSTGSAVNHPLKGPMTTQSLRGLIDPDTADALPLHWRGDRRFFQNFRNAFVGLHDGGGLDPVQVQEFAGFARTLTWPPNPYQPLDRVYTGAAASGFETFGMAPGIPGKEMHAGTDDQCIDCHQGDLQGMSDFTGSMTAVNSGVTQLFNMPTLRGVYEKNDVRQLSGFGVLHDGEMESVRTFFDAVQAGTGASLAPAFSAQDRDEVSEFVKQWDTGLAPLVGEQFSLTVSTVADLDAFLDLAEAQAQPPISNIDLVAKVSVLSGTTYTPVGAWFHDKGAGWTYVMGSGVSVSRAALKTFVQNGAGTVHFTCVPPGTGLRFGVDRDEDGLTDSDELSKGTNPRHPDTDGDGYADGVEGVLGGDPLVPDDLLADAGLPVLSELRALEVFADTATVSFLADEPVVVEVTTTRVSSGGLVGVAASTLLSRRHDVILERLPAGTELESQVVVTDRNGNESVGTVVFTTVPPMLHVDDLTLGVTGSGPYAVTATVKVVDHAGVPQVGVPVRGFWDGDLGGANWQQDGTTDAAGVAVFPLPMYTPAAPTLVTFDVAYIGSTDPVDPWFAGFGMEGAVPTFFYEQSMNAANHLSVDVPGP